jgi:hypothetical protein
VCARERFLGVSAAGREPALGASLARHGLSGDQVTGTRQPGLPRPGSRPGAEMDELVQHAARPDQSGACPAGG